MWKQAFRKRRHARHLSREEGGRDLLYRRVHLVSGVRGQRGPSRTRRIKTRRTFLSEQRRGVD